MSRIIGRLVRSLTTTSSLIKPSSIFIKPAAAAVRSTPGFIVNFRSYSEIIEEEKRMTDLSQYILPNETGICLLEYETAYNGLTDTEKQYAHYIGQASWYGGLICLLQTSPEAPVVYSLLQKIFRAESVEKLEAVAKESGVCQEEFVAFQIYASAIYSNMGNYKSFGDSKIIPNINKDKLELIIKNSEAFKNDPKNVNKLWDAVKDDIYDLEERKKSLGLGKKGITTYFSSNCDQTDADLIQEFFKEKNLSAYNTRLFKTVDNAGKPVYEIRLASVDTTDSKQVGGYRAVPEIGTYQFTPKHKDEAVTINVVRGDYSPLLKQVVDNLNKAKQFASNENQKRMLEGYIESFTTGSIPAHKDGSRYWIKDRGPIVENYIGFIESYRDPAKTRGEFEGFVAVVNKEMSAKFTELVEHAEHLLPQLPWPSAYEMDKFLRPDFTSLDVMVFSGSGIPAGINIPNYDEIRQDEGFKNVSLGNVLSAGYKDTKVTFLTDSDKELFQEYKGASFEVQVGLHELLGHGSGKLFQREADGKFNFDIDHVKHTETDDKIKSWYEPGETWNSKFLNISCSYEECRAECVGLYLCLNSEVLRIFGHDGDKADDIIYVNWLCMVRAGLLALEFYNPQSRAWGQAHMQARHVILRVLLEAGEGLVTLNKTVGEDGDPDLLIQLDRSKISSVGKPAIGKFLRKLQVYKATGDYKSGKGLYDHYSTIHDDEDPHFLRLRTIVLNRKQPRKMFVQCNTTVEDGKVSMKSYESTPAGLIQSFIDRYPEQIETELLKLAENDKHHFNY
ncbi:dipeptidyl peptidase 3-like isoform X2 [Tubulanus polymorphus]|uniref:dipeptidyl peptidase 3-like isoform X2 n=1 Tax=Tubulanus polymorphus TaxID=672921 RepID=UPI003DA508B1